MFYRRKYYIVKKEFVENFNRLFKEINLPNQLKNGARLVGRWMLDSKGDNVEIFAIWEYDSYEDYAEIESDIRSDRDHIDHVNSWYDQHGGKLYVQQKYFVQVKNESLTSTLDNSST
ncbi:NIPSNAP family protein [Psychrobacillus sp. NPDC096623]|uniref:NIPSNAP family protein n=1 Tax=Psychrobacillus sp. NPDC096623 TaxID=3364492 RepID=UPI003817A630